MRTIWHWLFISITGLLTHASSEFELKDHDFVQFDRSSPDYETILTPRDFERAEQLGNGPHYNKYDTDDPDAMYKKDLFEGDIANENASFSCFLQFLQNNCD
ncbi:hypothetical protein OSTOST_05982 [Ostertagia ostertagi]